MTISKDIGNSASAAYDRYQSSIETNSKNNSAMLAAQQRIPIHLEYLQSHLTVSLNYIFRIADQRVVLETLFFFISA